VTATKTRSGRLMLVLIAAMFIGPLVAAAWLYFQGGSLAPSGRTNHGALLEPFVALGEAVPDSEILDVYTGNWLLLYANGGRCGADCRDALYTLRQSRLMLGKDMQRLNRVFLHGQSAPDTVFLITEHAGLTTIEDAELLALLENKKPAALDDGGFFLIDPHRNLVMYFRPDIDPADMVDDIKHLFRLSRIG